MATTQSSYPRVCPECGVDLNVKGEGAKAHALSHWPEKIADDPMNKGALARQKILYDLEELDRDTARQGVK